MKFRGLAVTFLLIQATWGQSPEIKLPVLIPPSPEVAKLNAANLLGNSMHTGAPSLSIPLYSFQVNSVNVSVALNYGSNGIKVDEIPSRVGLGWNLIAGGHVSRVVHDQPDDDPNFWEAPTDLFTLTPELHGWIDLAADGDIDTEYDEYSYSFNGLSGKFFLDDNGNGICIPHNNFKVKVYNHLGTDKNVEIITGNGDRYEFGIDYKEVTQSVLVQGGNTGQFTSTVPTETTWFLEKITTAEGQVITFTYSSEIEISTQQGPFQTKICPPATGSNGCSSTDPGYSTGTFSVQTGINSLNYKTRYLRNISANGISIDLVYENRPDLSGDVRLINVGVKSSGEVAAKKWFKLSYEDPTVNNSTVNKRYFLTKVSELKVGALGDGTDLNVGEWLTHTFDYYDINSMPSRLSYSQDWFGYNNGVTNNYFAPYIPDLDPGYVGGTYGANRNAGNIAHMQKGMLKRVTYPTCGYQEFAYEPHTISIHTTTPTYESKSVNGSGQSTLSPVTYTSSFFTSNSDQQATIYLSSSKSPAFPDGPGNEGDRIFEFKLKKHSSGEVVYSKRYYYYTSETVTWHITANTSYKLELTVWGEKNAGSANIIYNPASISNRENIAGSGIRVKAISSFDPVSSKTHYKYYTYAALSDLNRSSGVGLTELVMAEPYTTSQACNPEWGYFTMGDINNFMVSSSSLSPYPTYSGSPIAYEVVIESDDLNFVNGCVEHYFYSDGSGSSSYTFFGNGPLSAPTNSSLNSDGLEYATKYYKKSGNSFILQKEQLNTYVAQPAPGIRFSTIVRERFRRIQTWPENEPDDYEGFDVVQYHYSTGWNQLESTTTFDYDENGGNPVTSKTTYTHDLSTHLQPLVIETTTSKGETINVPKVTTFKYPKDFSNPANPNVYDEMVLHNRIEPVVEQNSFAGSTTGTHLSQLKNNYSYWFSNSRIYQSSIEAALNGGQLENRISFNQYTNTGEILEQQKTADVKWSFIWATSPKIPVASVMNSSYSEIAYTGFELNNGSGNWSISSLFRSLSAVTGKRGYNLSDGNITKSVDPSTVYTITYWTQNTSPLTISGTQAGFPTLGHSLQNGWRMYVHKVTGVSNISISGAGVIDELRLCPASSVMTTYTIDPIVGVTSTADASGNITFYDYDGFNRLIHIKDIDGNILKKYEYAYCQNVYNCTNTTPNWQGTGVYQCVKNSNNNNTGVRQEQQRDMNICSSTYLQTQWVNIGTNTTSCPVVANCTAVYQRVVNGVCETGVRVITSSDIVDGVIVCTYHYEWSDGFWSQNYQGYSVDCAE